MPDASTSETPPDEIENVNSAATGMLWGKHSYLGVGMWTGAFICAVCIFLFIYFVIGDHAIASLSENDGSIIFLVIPLAIPVAINAHFFKKARREMMQQIGEELGYSYEPKAPISSVAGALFSIGGSRKVYDVLSGQYRDFPVRMFSFDYTVQEGKRSTTYSDVVFELTYPTTLPHIILHPRNFFGSPGMEVPFFGVAKTQLEGDFASHFDLYIGKEAQIEVREIFEPDVMQMLVEQFSSQAIEILNNKIYLAESGPIYDRAKYLELHTLMDAVIDKLIPGLHSAAEDTAAAAAVQAEAVKSA